MLLACLRTSSCACQSCEQVHQSLPAAVLTPMPAAPAAATPPEAVVSTAPAAQQVQQAAATRSVSAASAGGGGVPPNSPVESQQQAADSMPKPTSDNNQQKPMPQLPSTTSTCLRNSSCQCDECEAMLPLIDTLPSTTSTQEQERQPLRPVNRGSALTKDTAGAETGAAVGAEYTGGPCQGKSGCPCKDCAAFASVALPPSAPRTAWDEPQAAAAEQEEESDNDVATKMGGVREDLTTMAMAPIMSTANDEQPLPSAASSAVPLPSGDVGAE